MVHGTNSRPLSGSRTATCRRPPRGGGDRLKICGDHSQGETPGPIPNPEAKALHGDGTALERVWESSASPLTLLDRIPVEPLRGFPGSFSYIRGAGSRVPGPVPGRAPAGARGFLPPPSRVGRPSRSPFSLVLSSGPGCARRVPGASAYPWVRFPGSPRISRGASPGSPLFPFRLQAPGRVTPPGAFHISGGRLFPPSRGSGSPGSRPVGCRFRGSGPRPERGYQHHDRRECPGDPKRAWRKRKTDLSQRRDNAASGEARTKRRREPREAWSWPRQRGHADDFALATC